MTPRPFPCDKCARSFKTATARRHHKGEVHVTPERKAKREAYREAGRDNESQWEFEMDRATGGTWR